MYSVKECARKHVIYFLKIYNCFFNPHDFNYVVKDKIVKIMALKESDRAFLIYLFIYFFDNKLISS